MIMDCTLYTELLPDTDEIINKPNDRCPVDWALTVADIARMNNCGKSVMCRDGMQQLYTIIYDITTERGQPEDIELLTDICEVIKTSRGCALAARSSELICRSLELYPGEWDVHIRRKRCAASICYASPIPVRSAPEIGDGDNMTHGVTMQRRKRKGM